LESVRKAFTADESASKALKDAQEMEGLIAYLKVNNEASEEDLTALRDHISALSEIKTNNKLKAEAAMNEDFEMAIVYKKKITGLESKLVTAQ
jgi:SMC interacting uncharacterized protein involved in chromosome segregation